MAEGELAFEQSFGLFCSLICDFVPILHGHGLGHDQSATLQGNSDLVVIALGMSLAGVMSIVMRWFLLVSLGPVFILLCAMPTSSSVSHPLETVLSFQQAAGDLAFEQSFGLFRSLI